MQFDKTKDRLVDLSEALAGPYIGSLADIKSSA
jgi:hypothetical protein